MEWLEFGKDIDVMMWVVGFIIVGFAIWFFTMKDIE